MKAHIKRWRGRWVIQSGGVLVGWSISFRQACEMAAKWHREDLEVK